MSQSLWHYDRDGQHVGPFLREELQQLAQSGLVRPDTTLIGQDGNRVPAGEVLSFATASQPPVARPVAAQVVKETDAYEVPPPPPPPPLPTRTVFQVQRVQPWNPRLIGWLGLIFSPVWAGVMASINGRRLQTGSPVWRPIAIGVGSLLLDIFISIAFVDSYLLDLVLYLGGLWLIWGYDLQPQIALFDQQGRKQSDNALQWMVPSLAGAPIALLVFLNFIVTPFLPLEPREVCNRFVTASTAEKAGKYTTTNLWPALDTLTESGEAPWKRGTLTLTDEAIAPKDVGGYLVGFRSHRKAAAGPELVEGVFHLVDWQGKWQIENVYVTATDGRQLAEWLALSQHPYAFDGLRGSQRITGDSVQTTSTSDKLWNNSAVEQLKKHPAPVYFGLKALFTSAGMKKFGLVLLVGIGAGISALVRWLGGDQKT